MDPPSNSRSEKLCKTPESCQEIALRLSLNNRNAPKPPECTKRTRPSGKKKKCAITQRSRAWKYKKERQKIAGNHTILYHDIHKKLLQFLPNSELDDTAYHSKVLYHLLTGVVPFCSRENKSEREQVGIPQAYFLQNHIC